MEPTTVIFSIWANRAVFPETVQFNNDQTHPCFSQDGFAWALAIVTSRSVFVDGSSRLIPILDFANHDDVGVEEVQGGTMGTFGTTKGARLRAGPGRTYLSGDEVYSSYGPKSAARSMRKNVAELTFEVEKGDIFHDDKLDILEFETYDSAPMEPVQKFDVVSEIGNDEEPDPAMIQFMRLAKLGAKDAFLLESIFRKEVWEFMAYPVSQPNERDIVDTVADTCNKALEGMKVVEGDDGEHGDTPLDLCAIVRESESKALKRTLEFVTREKEALDLKEYYQERCLKDLGLDSEWNPEDDDGSDPYADEDLGFGQSIAPGSLDW